MSDVKKLNDTLNNESSEETAGCKADGRWNKPVLVELSVNETYGLPSAQ
jgi:hypothetical protein